MVRNLIKNFQLLFKAIIIAFGILFFFFAPLALLLIIFHIVHEIVFTSFKGNILLAEYSTSLVFLFIILCLSSSRFDNFINGENKFINEKKNPLSYTNGDGLIYMLLIFLCYPKRTIIYIIYFLILIINHLQNMNLDLQTMKTLIINVFGFGMYKEIMEYVKINEYTIVIIIAVDRIAAAWKKEKPSVIKNMITYIKEFRDSIKW